MNVWLVTSVTVALVLAAVAVRSRAVLISCPSCGGPAKLQEPYVMCDSCQRCIGLSVNNKIYTSRSL